MKILSSKEENVITSLQIFRNHMFKFSIFINYFLTSALTIRILYIYSLSWTFIFSMNKYSQQKITTATVSSHDRFVSRRAILFSSAI